MAEPYNITTILDGCRKRQSKYQRALVKQYSGYLFGTCKRYLKDDNYAKDLVQESLVRIFQNLDKYDAEKGSFPAWITTIAVRLCLNKLNKKKIFVVTIEDNSESDALVDNSEFILDKLASEYLVEMIRELPDGYREIFNMAAIDGFSHAEIAKHFEITEETSRARLSRARLMLRTKIIHLNNQELWTSSI